MIKKWLQFMKNKFECLHEQLNQYVRVYNKQIMRELII